jgi:hypothetical protein
VGPQILFLIIILIFILIFRSPCKNVIPYDNPFWDFSNSGEKKKRNNYQK